VSKAEPVSPQPGDVLRIHEDDYRFGLGELVLRVTSVRGAQKLDDGDWLTVAGVEVGRNGIDVGEREILVRLSRLAPQRLRS
jgi:hypothetical protein